MVARNTIHIDGRLGQSSPEVWSIGLTYSLDTGGALLGGDLQVWADWAASLFGGSTSRQWLEPLGTTGRVTAVRAYAYGDSGPAISAASAAVTSQPGTGVATNPYPTCRVYTLLTGTPGRSGRGRVYVPALVAPTDGATGKSTPVAAHLASFVTFCQQLTRLASGAAPIMSLGVHSRVQNALTPVSSIRVGDVLDTQRRRRDSLVESYTTQAL